MFEEMSWLLSWFIIQSPFWVNSFNRWVLKGPELLTATEELGLGTNKVLTSDLIS